MRRTLVDTLVALLILGGPFVFWATYAGPYEWIADFQISRWQSYDLKITFVLTWLLWISMVAGGTFLFSKLMGAEGPGVFSQLPQLQTRAVLAGSIAAPIVLLGIAGYFSFLAATYQTPVPFDVADLYAGRPLPSRYLRLTNAGLVVKGACVLEHTVTNPRKTMYVPVIPANRRASTNTRQIALYLELGPSAPDPNTPQAELPRAARPTVLASSDDPSDAGIVGITAVIGLPGVIRSNFARGPFPPSAQYILFLPGQTPESWTNTSRAFFFTAIIVALVSLYHIYRHHRRPPAPT